jgi:PAS domain S-box-containing protein
MGAKAGRAVPQIVGAASPQALSAVAFVAARFLAARSLTEAVPDALARLGEATAVSRMYVMRNRDEGGRLVCDMVNEWVAPGVPPQIRNPLLHAFDYEAMGFGRWIAVLSAGETIAANVRDLPGSERPALEAEDVGSVVCVPVFVDRSWWGSLGFVQVGEERDWTGPEIDVLKAAAGILGAAIGRERSGEALADSEERYRRLVELSPDGIVVHADGRVIFANDTAVQLIGARGPDDLVGRPVIEFVDPEYREAVGARMRRIIETGDLVPTMEERFVRLDGSSMDVEVAAGPFVHDGRPAVQVVFRDIADRKRTEREMRRQKEYLEALHETTLGVVNHLEPGKLLRAVVSRAAMLAGTEHGYLYVVDRSSDELRVEVGVGDFARYIGYRLRRGQGLAGRAWERGEPVVIEDYDTWEGRAPGFARGVLHAGMAVPLTSAGEVVGVIGIAHVEAGPRFDEEEVRLLSRFAQLASLALQNARLYEAAQQELEERRKVEGRLQEAFEREQELTRSLRALDEIKNTFLAAVSHELRTPLSAVMGVAVTLEREADRLPPEEVQELLAGLSANAHKLHDLLSDLLDLDRLRRGIVEPQRRDVDVGELVRRMVDETVPSQDRARFSVDAPTLVVPLDAPKVERIVENLLTNALRHTPNGARVWVAAAAVDGGALLRVEDEGSGIPEDLREEIFEPFRQGPSISPHAPGVGVGLSLVSRFAELHGGRAWVEDRAGGGAAFCVYLPGA